MTAIEKYFTQSLLDAIENKLVIKKEADKNKGKVPKEYKGYISSLGASIQQSGLIPTLAFYHDYEDKKEERTSGSEQDRRPILDILLLLLKEKNIVPSNTENLFQYAVALDDVAKERRLKKHLLDACVALKLALRTFKMTK